ncbi:MAG: hypothetical protein ABSE71_00110 [Candidatus Micrarchaeaceae archaeon]|jgi:hypothetical protein|nr:hypothetical protein [Candidatus Micrarchaeota archaeon]HII09521.1 hypothetical protein [Candidatus Micrarchaeota archaeon]
MQKTVNPNLSIILTRAIEKLRPLNVFPDNIRENAEIFERSTTIGAIGQEMVKIGSACGGSQFVYFHLKAMLERDSEFRSGFLDCAKKELGGFGISAEHVEEFFLAGTGAGLLFTLRHEKQYSKEVRVPFYERADQFALDKIRQWLGYS